MSDLTGEQAAVPAVPGLAAIATDDQTVAVYLAALRHPVLHRTTLLQDGFPQTTIDEALVALVAQGLATQTDSDHWQMTPPDVSLPSLAAQHEERARSLRESAPALARLYAEGQATGVLPLGGAEALTSVAAVDTAVQQIIAASASSMHFMHRNSPYLRSLLASDRERYGRTLVNSLGHPLKVRVTFDSALLEDDRLHPILACRAEKGDEQRVTRSLPFSAYVNDTGTAVLDLEDEHGHAVGLVLTQRAGAEAMQRLAAWAWQLGVAWRSNAPSPAPDAFGGRDREILRLLAAGSSDSTVARQLRISQRTVERRVRAILDQLNAVNRFQAGVIAARRGLL